jgi:autophagy-related protein 9
MAYPYAERYLDQFPKHKLDQLYNFIAFISGTLLGVLLLGSLFDPEPFLGFQITEGKTVLFYVGILTGLYNFVRSNVSSKDEPVVDPNIALSFVIECTHYCPASWKDRLHTDEVRQEFTTLYKLKVLMLAEELISLIMTPYILIFRLPRCSARIVDFFREFSIHVDGLGHVCSFAVFDFKKGVENIARAKPEVGREDSGLRDDYYGTKDAKLAASFMGFMENYVGNPTRYRRSGRNLPFHPPPSFSIQNLNALQNDQVGGRQPPIRGSQHTPRVNPSQGRFSPMHSILLDAHHQPSMSALRNSPMQGPQGRFRGTRKTMNETQEGALAGGMQRIATTNIPEEDDELDDSWKTTKPAAGDEEEEDAEQTPGVIGLLLEFQKRQTQSKGTKVGI